ncbi:MAG: hypothetical protein U5K30_08785 [Acidimicrobiales bacterium]|nr:hypothetical protein [Acidimicrobiales bacterium]
MVASPNGSDGSTKKKSSVSYPLKTRVAIVVVLAIGIGALVLAGLSTETGGEDDGPAVSGGEEPQATGSTLANGVEGRSPGRGTEALAQESIRLDLVSSWTGELTLRPESGPEIPIPDDQLEITELAELVFTPGENKAVERLPNGRICVRATIWDQVQGRAASERVESWCFDVT